MMNGIFSAYFMKKLRKLKMFDWLKKKRPDDGEWFDINEYPLIDSVREYLVSDGWVVAQQYHPRYNKWGKCVFYDGREREITHWRRYPRPPKRK